MPEQISLRLINDSVDPNATDFLVFQSVRVGGDVTQTIVTADDPNTQIYINADKRTDGYSLTVSATSNSNVDDFFQVTVEKQPLGATAQVLLTTYAFSESYDLTLDRHGRIGELTGTILMGGDTVTVTGHSVKHTLFLTFDEDYNNLSLEDSNEGNHVVLNGPVISSATDFAELIHQIGGEALTLI